MPQLHDLSPLPPLPDLIDSENALDDALTRPTPELIQFIRTIPGPLLIAGAGGKMGPTLAVLARRAAEAANHPLKIVAASRFSNAASRDWLEARGIRTLAADLLDRNAVARLPDASHVVFMVGMKFGTASEPSRTWATNLLIPVHLTERFAQATLAALSTGNVYPNTPAAAGGATESSPLTPLGEYANSAVGRERLVEFTAQRHATRVAILRLFYAVELRYGVLVDIARKVQQGDEIPLANGHLNWIWQGDANDMILRALALAQSPPVPWNLCRPEIYAVRDLALRFGQHLGRTPRFSGTESGSALLGNSTPLCRALGTPTVDIDTMIRWISHWIQLGGRSLNKPTHFEVRDGSY